MAEDDKTTFRELQRQLAKINESMAKLSGDGLPTPTFKDFAGDYMLTKLNNPTLRDSTKQSFRQHVRIHLIPAFGAVALDKITNPLWLTWVTDTRAKGGITRFFNARKSLVEILTAAKEAGHIEKVPKLDNPDAKKNVGRSLEDREVLKILRRVPDPMFRFFFYTCWKMGCRPREILKWEWSMFVWNEPGKTWLDVPARISKTDRDRSIAVNPKVSRRLYAQYLAGNSSAFVFPKRDRPDRPQLNYDFAWRPACERARVDAMVYDLRRTFVTRCAVEGLQMIYVAKHLDTSVGLIESVYAKQDRKTMEDISK